MSKYRQAQEIIIAAADMKMNLCSFKGSIENSSPERLVDLAILELQEVNEAIENNDYEKILVELGDTMNMLIGIAYIAINEYSQRKRNEKHRPAVQGHGHSEALGNNTNDTKSEPVKS